ncbi:MAG: hypothetical protein IPP25_11900 [Saprospiraceae bacterium]|nr:hypothetical protein [Candidatus Opimibacter skivensis]
MKRWTYVMLIILAYASMHGQVTLGKKDLKCAGDKNGKVSVLSIKNATYPILNYAWSNGASGPDKKSIENLTAGTYTVTVTDANQCTGTGQAVVEQPESNLGLDITSSADEFFLCGVSSIIVVAQPTGGTPPYNTNGSSGAYAQRVSLATFGGGPKYLDFQTTDGNGCTKKQRQFFAFSAVACPGDPNDINGPIGIEPMRWIAAKDRMEYTIRFENDPAIATAPAQVVKVTVPVDPKVNPFSIQLSDFGWGPFTFHVPSNSTFYQTRLDLRDSLNLYVDVTAGYNINTHEFFWMFESLDPVTLQLPADPLVGFLPVNDSITGSGEGFIQFSVTPKTNAITGDSIMAQADIVFDINESIFTNIWKNKLDAVAPVSALAALVDSSENDSILLHWSASDDPGGVGVRDYELFVSVDNGPFELADNEIEDTSYTYVAIPGFNYSFIVLATDRVGNRETMKSAAEGEIYIIPVRSINLLHPSGHNLCVMDSLTITWSKITTDSILLEMSLDSGVTYFTLSPSLAIDSFTIFLDDSLLSDNVFFRLSDLDDDSLVILSQPIVIHPLPIVDAGPSVGICHGDIIFLAATGANDFQWAADSTLNLLNVYNPRVTTIESREYYVTGMDVFGCQQFDSVQITVNPVYVDSLTHLMCNEDSVFVGGGYQTAPGFYTDSLASSTGCDSTVVTEVILTGPCAFPADQVYVDKDATGLNNGTSWANAFVDLQDALDAVEYYVDVTNIWVAEGDYFPSVPISRDASFTLRDSVKIYGGFVGTETLLEDRTGNETIVRLSGDLGVPNDSLDNAYHVIQIDPSCVDCVINSLTIKFGQGDGVNEQTYGAGLYVEGIVTLDGVTVERNTTLLEGAAIFNSGAGTLLTLRDCLFRLNTSSLARDILNTNGAEIRFEGMNTVED